MMGPSKRWYDTTPGRHQGWGSGDGGGGGVGWGGDAQASALPAGGEAARVGRCALAAHSPDGTPARLQGLGARPEPCRARKQA